MAHEAMLGRPADEACLLTPTAYLAYLAHVATYDFVGRHVSGRVLDLGCGPGHGTRRLAGHAVHVVGADVSRAALARAAAREHPPGLEWRHLDHRSALPFPDAHFDAIVAANLIEHVPAVADHLDEVRRVLRPGGTFWCATPDRRGRLYPGQRPWNPHHRREYDPDGLVSAVARRFADVQAYTVAAPAAVLGLARSGHRARRRASLPFTFPGAPERWRLRGLALLDVLMVGRPGQERASRFPFGPADVRVVPGTAPGHTLLVSAR